MINSFISVNFQGEMQNIFWLQPHKCEDLLFFFVIYGFLRWKKQFEDVIWGSEEFNNKKRKRKKQMNQ